MFLPSLPFLLPPLLFTVNPILNMCPDVSAEIVNPFHIGLSKKGASLLNQSPPSG
jgi:hypothetical protein